MAYDTRDGETELATEGTTGVTISEVPGLTILAHADRSRVGDRLALPTLMTRHELRLSRLEPSFRPVGRGAARPLGDRQLSRRPIRFRAGLDPGSVELDRDASRTPVTVGGEPVRERRVFATAEVEAGVVLLLGTRLVLLLHRLPATPPRDVPPHYGLVGESGGMLRLRREIGRVAALDVPVLLRGESGTGKELVARAIHDAGPRRDRPFVAVNMGALPPSLAAAELFGATRGAFTGADRDREGFFQRADGGTLLLDEIGAAPPEIQVMLLRVLETGRVRPMGGARARRFDVRVIAATDEDLETAIVAGRFRAPLYHRLAGYDLRLPALRERRDDFGRLFFHFLERELAELGSASAPIDHDAVAWPPGRWLARLAGHDWPGNVRELRNVARRLAIRHLDDPGADLGPLLEELLVSPASPVPASTSTLASPPAKSPKRRRFRGIDEVGDDELLATLASHRWRLKAAAEELGVSRATLYRLIERCPKVRKAAELDREEIERALKRNGGDPARAAAELEVSPQGLKRRLTALDRSEPIS